MIHDETIEFSWDTDEYEHREKSTDWYWALGILVVVIAFIAFVTQNLLFGFLVLMGGFMIGLFASKKNNPISIEISTHGVIINNDFIDFSQIKGFWLYRNPFGIRKLILKTTRNISPIIPIPLPDDLRAADLHTFLIKYVPEQELQESFVDLLSEKIGF